MLAYFQSAQFHLFLTGLEFIWSFRVIWLPIFLLTLLFQLWMRYVRLDFVSKIEPVLLELKVPKEVSKSPVAMEIVLQALHNPSPGNFLDVFLKGKQRPWVSLEIVSLDGQVHFFIWAPKGSKSMIESQLYSQYPTIEVIPVDDYTKSIVYDTAKFKFAGGQMGLTKPDPYPIKTYIDYGLDKDPKEEFKIDPITPVIEFLGSLKRGEQAWIQILIRAHKAEGAKDGRLIKKKDWKDAAKKEIQKILSEGVVKPKEGESPKLSELTQYQKDLIAAIERSLSKLAFDTMIRIMYVAEKDSFNGASAGGVFGVFKQFSFFFFFGFNFS